MLSTKLINTKGDWLTMLAHVCPFKWKQPRTKKNRELICHSVTSKYHRFFFIPKGTLVHRPFLETSISANTWESLFLIWTQSSRMHFAVNLCGAGMQRQTAQQQLHSTTTVTKRDPLWRLLSPAATYLVDIRICLGKVSIYEMFSVWTLFFFLRPSGQIWNLVIVISFLPQPEYVNVIHVMTCYRSIPI